MFKYSSICCLTLPIHIMIITHLKFRIQKTCFRRTLVGSTCSISQHPQTIFQRFPCADYLIKTFIREFMAAIALLMYLLIRKLSAFYITTLTRQFIIIAVNAGVCDGRRPQMLYYEIESDSVGQSGPPVNRNGLIQFIWITHVT